MTKNDEGASSFGRITAGQDVLHDRHAPLSRFVGRQWLVDEVQRFVDAIERRQLVIVGEPGSGKSMFIAHLAERWNCPRHFIRVGSSGGTTGTATRPFLCSIGAQLFQKYGADIFERPARSDTRVSVGLASGNSAIVGQYIDELYALPFLPIEPGAVDVSVGVAIRHASVIGERIGRLVDVAEALQPDELLHVAILKPLKKLAQLHPDERVVILVDAIDESPRTAGPGILDVLPRPTDTDWPANLRFLLTSRPGAHLARFTAEDTLRLDDERGGFKKLQEDDARRYIDQRLAESPLDAAIEAFSAEDRAVWRDETTRRSEGNFLYLHHFFTALVDALEKGSSDVRDVPMPADLDDVYRVFAVEKIKGSKGLAEWCDVYLPILSVLAVAGEPLDRGLLAAVAGVKVTHVDYAVAELAQFLDTTPGKRENRFSLYHRSFGEYLLDASRNREFPIASSGVHTRFVDHFREGRDQWGDVLWETPSAEYAFRHLPAHMVDAGRSTELFDLLDAPWIAAKLSRGGSLLEVVPDFEVATAAAAEAKADAARVIAYAVAQQTAREVTYAMPADLLRTWVRRGHVERAIQSLESMVGPLPRAIGQRPRRREQRAIEPILAVAEELTATGHQETHADTTIALLRVAVDLLPWVFGDFRQVELMERSLGLVRSATSERPDITAELLDVAADACRHITGIGPHVACLGLVAETRLAMMPADENTQELVRDAEWLLDRMDLAPDRLAAQAYLVASWRGLGKQESLDRLRSCLNSETKFETSRIVDSPLGVIVRKWCTLPDSDPDTTLDMLRQVAAHAVAAVGSGAIPSVDLVRAFCTLRKSEDAFALVKSLGGAAKAPGARALFKCVRVLFAADPADTRTMLNTAHESLDLFNRFPAFVTFLDDYHYASALAASHVTVGDYEQALTTVAASKDVLTPNHFCEIVRAADGQPGAREFVERLLNEYTSIVRSATEADQAEVYAAAALVLARPAATEADRYSRRAEQLSGARVSGRDLDPLRALVAIGLFEAGDAGAAGALAASIESEDARIDAFRDLIRNAGAEDAEKLGTLLGYLVFSINAEGEEEPLAKVPYRHGRMRAAELVPELYPKHPEGGRLLAQYLLETTIPPTGTVDRIHYVSAIARAFAPFDADTAVSLLQPCIEGLESMRRDRTVFDLTALRHVIDALAVASEASPEVFKPWIERMQAVARELDAGWNVWFGAELAVLLAAYDTTLAAEELERCILAIEKIPADPLNRFMAGITDFVGVTAGENLAQSLMSQAVADCVVNFGRYDVSRAAGLLSTLVNAIGRIPSDDDRSAALVALVKSCSKGPPELQRELAEVYIAVMQQAETFWQSKRNDPRKVDRSTRVYDEAIRTFSMLGLVSIAESYVNLRRTLVGSSMSAEMPFAVARSGITRAPLSALDRAYVGENDDPERWAMLYMTRMNNQGESLVQSFLEELAGTGARSARRALLENRLVTLLPAFTSVGGLALVARMVDTIETFDSRFESAGQLVNAS